MTDTDQKAMVELEPEQGSVDQKAWAMEKAAVMGDLSGLTPMERLWHYHGLCQSLGLNPLSKPFDYIKLNGRLVLYAKKDATDQLRATRKISITSCERDTSDPDFATWIVEGTDGRGRRDMEIGSVSISGLRGEAKANATMKALTKAKRRLTLSLAGLGMLDESELEGRATDVDPATGEVLEQLTTAQRILAQRQAPEALPAPPEPEVAPDATSPIREAPEPPSEPVEASEHMPPPPETATAICGDENEELGICDRAPDHPAGHRNANGAWPRTKKAKK